MFKQRDGYFSSSIPFYLMLEIALMLTFFFFVRFLCLLYFVGVEGMYIFLEVFWALANECRYLTLVKIILY